MTGMKEVKVCKMVGVFFFFGGHLPVTSGQRVEAMLSPHLWIEFACLCGMQIDPSVLGEILLVCRLCRWR